MKHLNIKIVCLLLFLRLFAAAQPDDWFIAALQVTTSPSSGWDINNLSYDNKSYMLTESAIVPYGIFIKPDGTKMFIVDNNRDSIYRYSLSTAWDVSTASNDNKSLYVGTQDGFPTDVDFSPDGYKILVSGNMYNSFYEYNLSTAWDVSTAIYSTNSLAAQEGVPVSSSYGDSGLKLYTIGPSSDRFFQFSATTSYDLSTTAYDVVNYSVSVQDGGPSGIAFKTDGLNAYMVGSITDSIYQYSLNTAWIVSSMSYENKSFYLGDRDGTPRGIFFKPDGTKMYYVGGQNNTIYQYSL